MYCFCYFVISWKQQHRRISASSNLRRSGTYSIESYLKSEYDSWKFHPNPLKTWFYDEGISFQTRSFDEILDGPYMTGLASRIDTPLSKNAKAALFFKLYEGFLKVRFIFIDIYKGKCFPAAVNCFPAAVNGSWNHPRPLTKTVRTPSV